MLALMGPDAFARGGGHGRSSSSSDGKSIYVHGYYRHDGTYVNSYYRSAPNSYRFVPYSNYHGSSAGDSDSGSSEPTPNASTPSPSITPTPPPADSTPSAHATPPAATDSAPKKYKWHHPWFNTDIVSDWPPPWPYEVIEEQNGVILVKVTPPAAPNNPTAPLAAKSSATPSPPPAETAPITTAPVTAPDSRYTEQQRNISKVIEALVDQTPLYQEGSLAGYGSGDYGGGYYGGGYYGGGRSGHRHYRHHGRVHVRSYSRRDGTYVGSHYRSAPRRR